MYCTECIERHLSHIRRKITMSNNIYCLIYCLIAVNRNNVNAFLSFVTGEDLQTLR